MTNHRVRNLLVAVALLVAAYLAAGVWLSVMGPVR